jgi:DNA-binding transcriptional MerR regulator
MSERLWYKIGEAADSAGVTPRDLRYWEKVIPEIRPRRSKGNQRHYHRDDLPKLRSIAAWVKNGFTIGDCRELLLNGSITRDLGLDIDISERQQEAPPDDSTSAISDELDQEMTSIAPEGTPPHLDRSLKIQLEEITESLKELLSRLKKTPLDGGATSS